MKDRCSHKTFTCTSIRECKTYIHLNIYPHNSQKRSNQMSNLAYNIERTKHYRIQNAQTVQTTIIYNATNILQNTEL